MSINNVQYNQMIEEYKKGGKFKDYIDKACQTYGDSVENECRKAIVKEYYISVTKGENK